MKKIMLSMAVLAAMCVGGYFGHSAYQESKLTDLELANVEALSVDENSPLQQLCDANCETSLLDMCKFILMEGDASGYIQCDKMKSKLGY